MIPDTKYEHSTPVNLGKYFSFPLSGGSWYTTYSSTMKCIHFCIEMGDVSQDDNIIAGGRFRNAFVTVEYINNHYEPENE